METLHDDGFAEKANLIFEFDPRSPLFVRRAEREIELQNIETAVQTLRRGLDLYPDYPVAHILLGKALSLLGQYDQAKEAYRAGCTIIDSKDSLLHYYADVEQVKKLRSPFALRKRATFVEMPSENGNSFTAPQRVVEPTFEDSLPRLAEQLAKAKISVPAEAQGELPPLSFEEIPASPPIISDTLARIYVSQGKYSEAINIYELLMEKYPERRSEMMSVIKELSARVQDQ